MSDTVRMDQVASAGKPLVAPLVVRLRFGTEDEWVIQDSGNPPRLVAVNLRGGNSTLAIATLLNNYLQGDGLCLLHLSELSDDGSCLACREGWTRHPFSVKR